MNNALPFRRYDEVDEHLSVLRRGATEDRLEPVTGVALEAEVFAEVTRLVRERRLRSFSDAGLIDLDYAVSLLPATDGSGTTLICLERVALRASFERFVERHALNGDERALALLLVGPYDDVVIAWRLACGNLDAMRAAQRLYVKTGVRDRLELQRAIDGAGRATLRRTRTLKTAARALSIA